MNVLDRVIGWFSPGWAMKRERARLMARHFEAASVGRRTDGWHRRGTDANTAASGQTLALLRAQARDLVRNNPWARRGLRRICTNTVGWGIRPKATGRGADRMMELFKLWGETTQCDAGGRLTFYGIQRQVMRTLAESGEVLIRRRMRLPVDGLAIPMQLQVLEPDFLDTTMDSMRGVAGGEIVQGIEHDQLGRRVAYWLFDQHPGGRSIFGPTSKRVPADSIIHVFDQERPGQVRGPSWFASVDVRLHDFAEFEDATLMKQKIAAFMAAFVTDLDGSAAALGQPGTDSASAQPIDTFEPGAIISLPVGKSVQFSNPPQATDHTSFSASALRGVAAGIPCVTYEDLTGDYSQTTYSSGRMGRLACKADVEDVRWNLLIPQFCDPVWNWMLSALILAGEPIANSPAEWSPPPMPILEPGKELDAYETAVRNGFMTWPQVVRELGYDPREQLAEVVEFNKAVDKGGVVFDCDPRKTSTTGQKQIEPAPTPAAAPTTDENDDEDDPDASDESARANGAAH